jgi:SDR family mycofactocin-dependent oxidoreductase
MSGLIDKVVVVTGAAKGMGRAHCERFADEGADVIAIDVPAATDELRYTAAEVEKRGRRCVAGLADVADLEAMSAVVDAAVADLGRLDVIVANAGIYPAGAPTWELTEEVWRRTLDVNLTGVWHTVKAGLTHFGDHGGAIIIISSTNGLRGTANTAHYTSSKHAVVGLARTLANELGEQGIRVNTVHPGAVATTMILNETTLKQLRPDLERPTVDDAAAMLTARHLLPVPWVEPVDVANAVVFLASDEARYITGTQLVVGGPAGDDGRPAERKSRPDHRHREGIGRARAVRFAPGVPTSRSMSAVCRLRHRSAPTLADLDETVKLVAEAGGRIVGEVVDVRDTDEVQAATDRGVEQLGALDVVCATAGITSRAMAVDLSQNAWQTMLDVNLTGVWATCRATAPHLIDRGAGSIILTSSITGLRGLVGGGFTPRRARCRRSHAQPRQRACAQHPTSTRCIHKR